MRIVMSGYYGFDNVGDEAILYSIIQALRKEESDVAITVLSNQPEKTAETYGVSAVNRWDLKQVIGALKNADGLISGGGSLLQDETSTKTIPYYAGIIKIAQFVKKPVFVYAQGMGPINQNMSKKFVKYALKKTKITVRDVASKDLLRSIGVKTAIDIVPDPVLGITLQSEESSWWDKQSFTGPVVTVSVRDWPSEVDYKKKIAEGLDLAAKAGNKILFVPMHGEHDNETSKEVAAMMSEKSVIAPFDASIEEKILIIGKSNLLVGMRLHALIFAGVMETPFIALSYDPKIDAFAEISGQTVAGHVNEANWEAATLFAEIRYKLENEASEISKLRDKIVPLKEQAQDTARQAVQYFRGGL